MEQWRSGSSNAVIDNLPFEYSFDANALGNTRTVLTLGTTYVFTVDGTLLVRKVVVK